jgi:hypothetical protein
VSKPALPPHSTTLSHTQARCSNASSSLPLLCPARLRKRSSPAEVRAPAPHGAHIHLACAVSSTLPPTVGACGRPCNGTITCKSTVGPDEACSGADAAVPYNIFYACAHCCLTLCSFTDASRSNYNASLPAAKNPICGHHVECKRAQRARETPQLTRVLAAIGPISTLSATICSFCTEPACGPTDLLLSDPAHNPGSVGEWILFSS